MCELYYIWYIFIIHYVFIIRCILVSYLHGKYRENTVNNESLNIANMYRVLAN